ESSTPPPRRPPRGRRVHAGARSPRGTRLLSRAGGRRRPVRGQRHCRDAPVDRPHRPRDARRPLPLRAGGLLRLAKSLGTPTLLFHGAGVVIRTLGGFLVSLALLWLFRAIGSALGLEQLLDQWARSRTASPLAGPAPHTPGSPAASSPAPRRPPHATG